MAQEEEAKGARIGALGAEGHDPEAIRKILKLEEEIEEYKKKACEVIGVSMATYYSDPKVTRAEKEERDADLRGKIVRGGVNILALP